MSDVKKNESEAPSLREQAGEILNAVAERLANRDFAKYLPDLDTVISVDTYNRAWRDFSLDHAPVLVFQPADRDGLPTVLVHTEQVPPEDSYYTVYALLRTPAGGVSVKQFSTTSSHSESEGYSGILNYVPTDTDKFGDPSTSSQQIVRNIMEATFQDNNVQLQSQINYLG